MSLSVFNIRPLILSGKEDLVKSYIETFSCVKMDENGQKKQLNPDIERFLKSNAIQFAKMKTAITYFVSDSSDGAFLGYFTLAHKSLDICADGISRKTRDKIQICLESE